MVDDEDVQAPNGLKRRPDSWLAPALPNAMWAQGERWSSSRDASNKAASISDNLGTEPREARTWYSVLDTSLLGE